MLTPPATVEAILFASGESIRKEHLATLLSITETELEAVLRALSDSLKGRGIALLETETAVELRTSPEAFDIIKKLRENEFTRDLGSAGLETFAVIAYQEGATRSDIDWVRGVNSSTSLRTLLLRGLIEGVADPLDKRRIRYNLTTEALAHLGVARASELPRATELKETTAAIIEEEAAHAAAEDLPT